MLDKIKKWICGDRVERFILHTYDGQPDAVCVSVYECTREAIVRAGSPVLVYPEQFDLPNGHWLGYVEGKINPFCSITRTMV